MPDSLLLLINKLSFQWPWLWLLLPVPLLFRYLPEPVATHNHSVRVPALPHFLSTEAAHYHAATRGLRRQLTVWALIWCALVCAATRPQWLTLPIPEVVSTRDLVLVLDVSGSMATQDMVNKQGAALTRIGAMQDAVRRFINARKDDNIGLVVFGTKAYPFAPLSRDHQILLDRINDLQPAMAGPQTSIGDALGSTIKMYQSLGDTPEGNERMVVLLTDGQDTSSTLPPDVALRLAKKERVIIHTIALAGGNGESINLALLKKIANETGGTFHQVDGRTQVLQQVYDTINRLAERKIKNLGWSYSLALYPYPLAAALCGLFVLAVLIWSARRKNG
ncbi:VWA domain-containing protein [Klebsiella sp. R390]|uniref:VWA domain-containing protein n=1 Tax=Klebsiella sp. R390 TaxID=2755400 RepID=UPI003DA87090